MQLKTKLYVIIAFLLLVNIQGFADHIVGGEMTYKYLSGDDYEVTLTMFRVCGETAEFDDPARIGVFNGFDALLNVYSFELLDTSIVEQTTNLACYIPPALGSCYEKARYRDTLNLPALTFGYTVAYQRCCRDASISNISSPGSVGATYFATIPGASAPVNSSPLFINPGPTYLCSGTLLSVDYSAIDSDGDSLAYELYEPYTGASLSNAQPNTPSSPPYNVVNYSGSYSVSDMLGGAQPLAIDPVTGLLTAIPNTSGRYVVGIKVKEYRNSVLIGETKRDFEFNVGACEDKVNAIAPADIVDIDCETSTVQFVNSSTGATSYSWYFGDPSVTDDSSNVFEPSYVYPALSTYTATLIARDVNPLCNDTVEIPSLFIPQPIDADFSYTVTSCTGNVAFTDLSTNNPTAWSWGFGDGTTAATTQNTSHSYALGSQYVASLVATRISDNCTSTIDTIFNFSDPSNVLFQDIDTCVNNSVVLSGSGANSYLWSPAAGLDDATIANPTFYVDATTTFTINVLANNEFGVECPYEYTSTVTALDCEPIVIDTVLQTSVCEGANVIVLFHTNRTFEADNEFSSQIVDLIAGGEAYELTPTNSVSFNGIDIPQNVIGSFLGFPNSEVITATIPSQTPTGIYNLEVISSSPTGAVSTGLYPILYEELTVSITSICQDDNTLSLTVEKGGANPLLNSFVQASGGLGLPVSLVAEEQNAVLSWSTGEISETITADEFGNYSVIYKDTFLLFGCTATDTITFQENTINDLCDGDYAILSSEIDAQSYLWSNGSTDSSLIVDARDEEVYMLSTLYPYSCTSLDIDSISCNDIKYFVPNMFTPNGDLSNDVLYVRGNNLESISFAVYNRWGEVVFETDDQNDGWDGTSEGDDLGTGLYAWKLFAIHKSGEEFEGKGNITLVR